MTRRKKMRQWSKLCGGCSAVTYFVHFHDDGKNKKSSDDVGQNNEE
ncbi:MAG: hypothetical protein WC244_01875 [Patescibacteria group bacterium]